MVVAVFGGAAGLIAGVLSGPLWLDETLSVEIARLPLPEVYAALRQDGAPPVYYLLLKVWMAAFGTGTVAVRLLSVLLTVGALLLAHRLGRQLGGVAGGRAALVVLAALPWTMRFGSEARMYMLVVVLVLAGTLALLAVHRSASRRAVFALAACVLALLLTHYWSLFLLLAVGALHLPGLLRRHPASVRVAVAGSAGALAFTPWLPTLLFQAAHTGAPWAVPTDLAELLRTPAYWGGGSWTSRTVLAVALVALVVLAAVRLPVARALAGVAGATLLLAWTSVAVGGGAYTGRYTAVAVPLVVVAVGLGAVALPGRRWPLVALGVTTLISLATGLPSADGSRTFAGEAAAAFRASAAPGDLLVSCPDQLGPPMARLLGPAYQQVVYPSLAAPQRIDWVDYRARQDAADPAVVAGRVDALAGDRRVFVLLARDYRTFEGDCEELLRALRQRRGTAERLYGTFGSNDPLLVRFPRPRATP
ncbi:MAG: glycosyltransferase family 39 protein [Actinobacteria bacterium]|nr:glycosyltransferase family 39 protein [Actinomycetota bacterium]